VPPRHAANNNSAGRSVGAAAAAANRRNVWEGWGSGACFCGRSAYDNRRDAESYSFGDVRARFMCVRDDVIILIILQRVRDDIIAIHIGIARVHENRVRRKGGIRRATQESRDCESYYRDV